MLYHKLSEPLPVDKDEFGVEPLREVDGFFAEAGCRDEDTLLCSVPLQSSGKPLDVWSSNCVVPAFGLNVDDIQTQLGERWIRVSTSKRRMFL